MEFSRQGLEELFSDGVVNPAVMSGPYLKNCTKFKELESRVFLLYEPDPTTFPDGADFDVILLHGIGSDEFTCWSNEQGLVWPAVFLPQDFPTARVITVGYAHSLFNWKAEEDKSAETAAQPLPISASNSLEDSQASADPTEVEGGAFQHIKSLADKVGQTAKESVSTYAPKEVADWWTGAADSRGRDEATPPQVTSEKGTISAPPAERDLVVKSSEDLTSPQEAPTSVNNPLFQLLTRIRDSTGSLVAAEDEGSAANLSGSAQPMGDEAGSKDSKTSRDVRSLQNMRIVAAELAERLGGASVGVGQRPVVFLVHSMGGLILKQMLISLFEAARLAPPSAAALSMAALPKKTDLTSDETAVSQNCAAVRKANMLLRAVRGVVFYGTPHFGSAVASVITGLQKYYQGLGGLTPTSVVTGLGDHNKQELVRLNDRFFDVVERLGDELSVETPESTASEQKGTAVLKNYMAAMEASLAPAPSTWGSTFGPASSPGHGGGGGEASRGMVCILSFGETKKLNGLVRVVDPESANPAPDDPRYPFYLVNADHGEVCRPLTKMSPSYAMVYGLLDRMQQRGLLKWPRGHRFPTPTQARALLPAPPGSADSDTGASTAQDMCERYESGWSALFDPARPPSTTPVCTAEDANSLTVDAASAAKPHADGGYRNYAAFQQGVGEMRLALPVLEEALADLHQLLHRFFGVAVPPQLDSIFLLAADVTDFVTRFYRREALIAQTGGDGTTSTEASASARCSDGGSLVDEVVSFRVPLQLLIYWVQQAAELLRVFELSQQERAIDVHTVGSASPTAAQWESNLSMHPGSRDLRELSELEQSVGVVQEEWEAFRRYVSLRIRAVSAVGTAHGAPRRTKPGAALQEGLERRKDSLDLSTREHIAALFFARAIRTIVSQHMHDGGALGGLLGAYLRSAILQIRGSEKQLSSATFKHNPWVQIESVASTDSASIVALVMEGLELSISPSPASEDSSVLMDSSGSGVDLKSDVELRGIVPALTATSSMLLGCFALFVDKMHRLDSGARWPRAAAHFQLAISSLRADSQVRARLLRAASQTMQKEGLVSSPSPDSVKKAGGADKEWWKAAWELTTTKNETAKAASSGVAGALTDHRQGHVAKLDDGLFLSAMQLVAASFQCSIRMRACHAHRALPREGRAECDAPVGAHPSLKGEATGRAEDAANVHTAADDTAVEALVRSVEAAQKAYIQTTHVLRGTFALSDTEKPFAPPGDEQTKKGGAKAKGVDKQPERSLKDQLRHAIQGILSELDEEEVGEGEESTQSHATARGTSKKTAVEKRPSISWTSHISAAKKKTKGSRELVPASASSTAVTASAASLTKRKSRKNSLPMLIMNSLSKAWDAVRSGGAEAETPEHFAHTALVMWWMVESEAVAVLKAASSPPPAVRDSEASSTSTSSPRARVRALVESMEAARQRRRERTTTSDTAGSAAAATLAPASRAKAEEKERAWERQCWSNANVATQCRWMIRRGGEEFLDTFHGDLATEREELERILRSTSASQLRESHDSFVPPAALLQLDGEGGAQLGIPSSLLDAVQHDDTSAALRCWLGHCYAAHRLRSPDTAHAYMQVIRNDYAAHKEYTPTAEVGLAWSHIHNVPCSFAQLWRGSREASAKEPESSTGKGRLDVRKTASLLDFRSTGVIDTSALHNVPPHLLQFCHDAVGHHTDAVQQFIKAQHVSTPASPAAPRDSQRSSALLHAVSLQRPFAHAGVLRHLRLAEEGFQRALDADPANIGALCGLGRLRCLSVSPALAASPAYASVSPGLCGPHGSGSLSHQATASARQRAGMVSSAEAVGFFSAALNVGARNRLAPATDVSARQATPESCAHAMDNVWLSYAAYWIGEESRRTRVTGGDDSLAKLNETGGVQESTEWLLKSLRYYPRNDWALTSLGLSDLTTSSSPALEPHTGEGNKAGRPAAAGQGNHMEVSQLRGLALLQRALAINPTNMWALWGVGTYGTSTAHRSTCQRILRSLILKNIPRL